MSNAEMMSRLHDFMLRLHKDRNVTVTDEEFEAMKKAMMLFDIAMQKYEEKQR